MTTAIFLCGFHVVSCRRQKSLQSHQSTSRLKLLSVNSMDRMGCRILVVCEHEPFLGVLNAHGRTSEVIPTREARSQQKAPHYGYHLVTLFEGLPHPHPHRPWLQVPSQRKRWNGPQYQQQELLRTGLISCNGGQSTKRPHTWQPPTAYTSCLNAVTTTSARI